MSSPQFDRKCAITIGNAGGTGVRIDNEFRVVFQVDKDVTNLSNTGNVAIYNLSKDTRNQIERWDRPICTIEAGYGEDLEVLAIFEVFRTQTERQGPDWITKIELVDGARQVVEKKVNVSFAAGTRVSDVVDRLKRELGLTERITGAVVEGEYLKGISLSGPVSEALTTVLKKAGLDWSIQNNELQILSPFAPSQGRGLLISPNTGLISVPQKLFDSDQVAQRLRGIGWGFRTLLNPSIRPGERIVLQSEIANATLRIDSVSHSGDTRGQQWETYTEAFGNV